MPAATDPRAALYSSASDDWATPRAFFDRLDVVFGFTLDVCSSVTNHKADTYYALDHPDPTRRNGLTGDWVADAGPDGAIWMNPPYGATIEKWMRKAHHAALAGATVVCLVPVRTSTGWWHELVLNTGAEVCYIQGRLTFGDAKHSAPFASAVVIYRPDDTPGRPGPATRTRARSTDPYPVRGSVPGCIPAAPVRFRAGLPAATRAARTGQPPARAVVCTPLGRRRRRAGWRPGRLSPDLRSAITAEAAALDTVADPLACIDAVGDTFAALDDALAEVALPRLRAVAHLRHRGWSYDRVAAATKLSKSRVAQLAREAQARGL